MTNPPTEPGYFWAKLVTPYYGGEAGEDWKSLDWEIVEVYDNNGSGDEQFAVHVFGVPYSQWLPSFVWGPKVTTDRPL